MEPYDSGSISPTVKRNKQWLNLELLNELDRVRNEAQDKSKKISNSPQQSLKDIEDAQTALRMLRETYHLTIPSDNMTSGPVFVYTYEEGYDKTIVERIGINPNSLKDELKVYRMPYEELHFVESFICKMACDKLAKSTNMVAIDCFVRSDEKTKVLLENNNFQIHTTFLYKDPNSELYIIDPNRKTNSKILRSHLLFCSPWTMKVWPEYSEFIYSIFLKEKKFYKRDCIDLAIKIGFYIQTYDRCTKEPNASILTNMLHQISNTKESNSKLTTKPSIWIQPLYLEELQSSKLSLREEALDIIKKCANVAKELSSIKELYKYDLNQLKNVLNHAEVCKNDSTPLTTEMSNLTKQLEECKTKLNQVNTTFQTNISMNP